VRINGVSHVFVSYSKKDKDYVLKFVDRLLDEGFDVWIDNRGLRSSEDWWRAIVEALRDCSAFVVVLTPNSDASEWVQLEITLATKYKKPRFPVLLSGTMDTPNWEIFARTQYIDVTDGQLPQAEFYNLLGKQAPRKSFRGRALSDTGRLDQKIGPFVEDDPILLEAISSPPLKIDEGEDFDLTPLGIKIPPHPDPRIETAIAQAVKLPDSQPAAISDPKPPRSLTARRAIIALAALLMVAAGITAFVFASNRGQAVVSTSTVSVTPTPTPVASTATATARVTSEILAATSTPNLGATPVNIDSLNNWLVENGHTALKENPILSELAQRQRSYLMSLSVTDFNALDSWYRDRDGRNAQEMAEAMGYKGEVQMIIEVSSSVIMLEDALDKIETSGDGDVYSRFHEIGVDFQSSLTTDPVKVFFVLILGSGTPS
jgi:hypothetical protein